MKKCLNCGAEFQDDSLSFCDCGGPLVKIHQANESSGRDNQQRSVPSLNDDEVEAFIESLDETPDEIGEDDPLKPGEEDDEIEEAYGEILEVAPEELRSYEVDGHQVARDGSEEDTDDVEVEPDIQMTDKSFEGGDIQSILKDLFGEDVMTDEEEAKSDTSQRQQVESEAESATVKSAQNILENHGTSDAAETDEEERIRSKASIRPITSGIQLTLYRLKSIVAQHEMWYDEILIGRSRTGLDVDINLRDVDDEKLTSRRHAKIYRENGAYYIQRLSQKAPVWVRGKFLELGESVQLYDGDRVILSNSIGLLVRNIG